MYKEREKLFYGGPVLTKHLGVGAVGLSWA